MISCNVVTNNRKKKKKMKENGQLSNSNNASIQELPSKSSQSNDILNWPLIEAYLVKEDDASPPREFSSSYRKGDAADHHTAFLLSVFVPRVAEIITRGHFDTKAPFSLTFLLHRLTSRVVHHDASNIGGNTHLAFVLLESA